MRKILLAAIALAVSSVALTAKDVVSRKLDAVDFSGIDAASNFRVEIVKSSEQSVELRYSEELEPYVVAQVRNGKLELYLDTKKMGGKTWFRYMGKGVNSESSGSYLLEARISTDRLESIEASGAAYVSVEGRFKTDYFNLDISGSSKVDGLEISGRKLDMEVSGASKLRMPFANFDESDIEASGAASVAVDGNLGKVDADFSGAANVAMSGNYSSFSTELSGAANLTVSGKSDSLSVDASGAGSFKGQELYSGSVFVSGSGASNIVVHPTEKISVDISGACSLRYAKGADMSVISISRGSSVETY